RWALAPDALRLLASLVRHLRPRHVLEFGSGLSTQVLTWASQGLPDCRIASIDHDPEFSEAAARQLSEACPGADRVAFHVAHLVLRDCGGQLLPVYQLAPDVRGDHGPADLILIDGPPEPLGGREGMLYQAMEHARPGSLVLLDDAGRRA